VVSKACRVTISDQAGAACPMLFGFGVELTTRFIRQCRVESDALTSRSIEAIPATFPPGSMALPWIMGILTFVV